MTETVEKLIVALDASQYKRGADDIAQSGAAVAQSSERIVTSEEKVTKATRTTADGFQRLEARYDPLIAAERRRSAAIAQATRYLDDGSISQERYRAHIMRVTAAHDQEVARIKMAGAALDQHNATLSRLGGGVSQVTNLMGAFGVTLGVAGLVQFGRHVVETVGNLGEQAQQIGLNIEQFQVYRAVALQAGASQEQLQTGVQKFTRTIEEAMQGQDEAIAKFGKYKISLLDVNGAQRDTADILQDVAVKVANAGSETERGKIAFDLFGRSGQNLIPTLVAMSSGYAKNAEEAKKLGMVVKDDLVKKYDELGDAMERVKVRSVVWAAEFGYEVFDAYKKIVSYSLGYEESIYSKLYKNHTLSQGRIAGGVVPPPLPAQSTDTGPARLPVSETQVKKSGEFERYLRNLEQEAYLSGLVTEERTKEKALFDAIAAKGGELTPREKERVLNAVAASQAERERWKFIEDTKKALEDTAKADQARNLSLEKYIQGLESQPAIIKATGVELEVGRAIYEAQNKLIDEQGRKLRDLTELERARIESAVRTKAAIEKEKDASNAALRELESFAERSFDRIGGTITQMFVEGKSEAVNFRNTAMGVISDLGQEFIKLAALNPLKNFLFGTSSPTLGGFFGDLFEFENGGVMTAAGEVPLRRYSSGGVADRPQLSLYGEGRTPEAYVPLPDGRSIPVTMNGGGMGGNMQVKVEIIDQHVGQQSDYSVETMMTALGPYVRVVAADAGAKAGAAAAKQGVSRTLRTDYGMSPQPVAR